MADVVFNLNAEEGQAVGAFLKLVEVQKKAEDGMRKLGKASKDFGDEFQQASSIANKRADEFASKMSTVTDIAGAGAAGIIGGAWTLIASKIEEATTKGKKFHEEMQSLLDSAAMAGKIDLLPKLTEQLKSDINHHKVEASRVSPEERTRLLSSVMSGVGARLDEKGTLESAEYAIKAQQSGNNGVNAGQIYGTLRSILTEASGEKLQTAAGQIMPYGQISEVEATKAREMKAGGASDDAVIRRLMVRKMSGEKSKAISTVDDALANLTDENIKRPTGKLSDEQQARVESLNQQVTELDKIKLGAQTGAVREYGGVGGRKGIEKKISQEMEALHIQIREIQESKTVSPEAMQNYETEKRIAGLSGDEKEKEFYAHPEIMKPQVARAAQLLRETNAKLDAAPATDVVAKGLEDLGNIDPNSDLGISLQQKKSDTTQAVLDESTKAKGQRENLKASKVFNDLKREGATDAQAQFGAMMQKTIDAATIPGEEERRDFNHRNDQGEKAVRVQVEHNGFQPLVRGGGNAGVE